jgi:CPA1 family monovalent cation:H+ antiporter
VISASVVVAFLAAITLLSGVAARSGTPYPVVLVLGGFAMGVIPGIPSPALDPDLVLVLFLPPLLYSAAFLSSVEELRANAWPVLELAVGLVLATVGAVAAVGALLVGLPWAVAFVLGAIVGPTDPVSASAILQRLGAPERLVTILEGESLVNDATAITAYAIAITAVETGRFSLLDAVGTFAFEVAVGTAIGLAVAWIALRLRRWVPEAGVQLAFTLLTPYVAYVGADEVGASGVLAAVAAGLYAALRAEEIVSAQTRLELSSFWALFVFLLNAILFLMIGAQLPHVLDGIGGGLSARLAWHALVLTATVLALRFAWMIVLPFVTRALRRGEGATRASRGAKVVLGWSGMRGAVSLAIALAVPLRTDAGHPFPHRESVVFFAYAIVLLTLVPPGFTLGPLIRRLGLQQGGAGSRAVEARQRLLHAALEEIDARAAAGELGESGAARLRGVYEARLDRLAALGDEGGDAAEAAGRYLEVRRAVIRAQRAELTSLRAERSYPVEALRRLEHELDLDEARLPRRPAGR